MGVEGDRGSPDDESVADASSVAGGDTENGRRAEHEQLRGLLGGYVLGVLTPEEDDRVTAHLEHCRRCERELVEVAGATAALSLLDLRDLPSG